MKIHALFLSILLAANLPAANAQQNPAGLVLPKTAKVQDVFTSLPSSDVAFNGGILGTRYDASVKNRLLVVDENDLLDCFERRNEPHQDWQGEHAGKFLHAASLTWANTKSPALKAKLDRVVTRLLKTQEADGYLGAYKVSHRWTSWDVWVHKYNLLGLLTYYQQTQLTPDKADDALGKQSLEACKRMGDLLLNTFGTQPGQRDINKSGEHMGMAPDSVLEAIVLLYRATNTPRYLDFARYIVANYDAPGGPKILTTLKQTSQLYRVANGKAYEMLSNFNGLLEFYRVTGDKSILDTLLRGWKDIVDNRLYPTGSASSKEHFQDDHVFPDGEGDNICETCVTVTWEQFNLQLLRLTGEARFAQELERSIYNHLLAAQKPTGEAWSYYTPLRGRKPYSTQTNCCLSSGPRGVALLPSIAYMTSKDGGLVINLYNAGTATVQLPSGKVKVTVTGDYPAAGAITIKVEPEKAGQKFPVYLRLPIDTPLLLPRSILDHQISAARGYTFLKGKWLKEEVLQIGYRPTVQILTDEGTSLQKLAVQYGVYVLALDTAHNPQIRAVQNVALAVDGARMLNVTPAPKRTLAGEPVFQVDGLVGTEKTKLYLTPYAFAGQDGKSRFAVWLRHPKDAAMVSGSLFANGESSRSRQGNASGEISDDETSTYVVTYDGKPASEDWYAVSLPKPVTLSRVVFAHGHTFHDGGWFDTSAGKPRIQVQETVGSEWKTVATLDSYPQTSATNSAGLKDGQTFEGKFPAVKAVAVRILGKPAHGDNPAQAFSSCAELQAY